MLCAAQNPHRDHPMGTHMGINRQSEESADLQVGPTTAGMVRIYVSSGRVDLPMDFTPDDAEEIARELMTAAEMARQTSAAPPVDSREGRARRATRKAPPRRRR